MFSQPENLPPITFRKSTKARHIRLQICARKGLQLIIPKRCSQQEIDNMLSKNQLWIEKNWLKFQDQRTHLETKTLPEEINFLAVQKTIKITYEQNENLLKLKTLADDQLCFIGDCSNSETISKLLRIWLRKYASKHLLDWLAALSEKSGLNFTGAGVRNTLSLWGSCTPTRRISLSSHLLFLPPAFAEYVILHELCHTVHLNHSKHFWQLLKQFNPNCLELRRELKTAQAKYLPWYVM